MMSVQVIVFRGYKEQICHKSFFYQLSMPLELNNRYPCLDFPYRKVFSYHQKNNFAIV